MIIKQVRLSQQAKDQLSRLKGKTGIKNWNVLCRWALCYSLSEKTIPTDIPIAADSNLEMSWYTFGGEYHELYEAIVKAWCIEMGLPTDDDTIIKYFRLNLERGIAHLCGTGFIKNIDDLLDVATKGKQMSVYLDYNASAPIDCRVVEAMMDVYQNYIGNADSRTHDYGDQARAIVEDSRKKVAALLNVNPTEVFFTSGATESNNIAILGLDEYANQTGKKHIITTAIEHKAVLETVKAMGKKGYDIDILKPDHSGRISVESVISKLREDTLLVSVMHVNNETGIIQPVEEIGSILNEKKILFHVDATQSCGKLVDELRALKYDMLSFSAHKLRGPQGIGVLILRKKRYKLPPVKQIMYGGQQEHGIRPGTIPVALVAGCGKACEIAAEEYMIEQQKLVDIKGCLKSLLDSSGINYHFNGDQKYCVNNTANICFPGVVSEALMLASKQYCSVSNGSACTSKSYSPSYVLSAMGIPENDIECSLRISWGGNLSVKEFSNSVNKLIDVAKQLK